MAIGSRRVAAVDVVVRGVAALRLTREAATSVALMTAGTIVMMFVMIGLTERVTGVTAAVVMELRQPQM